MHEPHCSQEHQSSFTVSNLVIKNNYQIHRDFICKHVASFFLDDFVMNHKTERTYLGVVPAVRFN